MVKISDVQVEGGVIEVKIVEPRVGNIIIQGNKKTKTKVIERELKLKKGDPFNATILRHSINRLQGKGFFEDVSVGFEPGEEPDMTDIILTVSEAKTGRVGLSISHGTESGWSGGLTYSDTNWKGLGHIGEVGFETGDNEQYWISYSEPYMDSKHFAWKVGFAKRKWEDRYYYRRGKLLRYDDEIKNIYLGAGKKFGRDENTAGLSPWTGGMLTPTTSGRKPTHPNAEDELTRGKIFPLWALLREIIPIPT